MAFETYLKIDGVKGESKTEGHADEIEVMNFSWGLANASSGAHGGGLSSGKANHGELHFTKRLDKSSTVLMKVCGGGESKGTATLSVCKSTGKKTEPYMQIHLTNAYVTSIQLSGGSHGEDYPTENVSLAYEEIKVEYSEQDGANGLKKGASFHHNLKTNKIA